MPDQYYYSGRSGESFVGATVHADRECSTLSESPTPRPVAASSIEKSDVTMCPECTTVGDPVSCQVVKQDGEVCGRERPCPYHD